MPDVTVATALISAGVAAATTVAVDFAAKPALEVRKYSALQHHRERQQLAHRLIAIQSNMQDASTAISMRGVDDALPQIAAASDQLQSERILLEDFLPRALRQLMHWQLGYMAALVNGSLLVRRTFSKEEDVQDRSMLAQTTDDLISTFIKDASERWSELPAQYLRASRWQLIRKFKIRRAAQKVIAAKNAQNTHATGK